jgi:DNA-directed RNA polymerase subunit RPC12/RpoP
MDILNSLAKDLQSDWRAGLIAAALLMEVAMAWFLNHYVCEDCEEKWSDEWSATCDDDCPHCGSRHMSPYKSIDLTDIVEEYEGKFLVYRSPDSAEDSAEYELIAECDTRQAAEEVLQGDD